MCVTQPRHIGARTRGLFQSGETPLASLPLGPGMGCGLLLRCTMLASSSPFFGLACRHGRGLPEYAMSSKTSLDKSRIKFLLLEGIHPSAVEVLRAAGYTNIESLPGALPDAELKAKIADVHFVGIRSRTQLTA